MTATHKSQALRILKCRPLMDALHEPIGVLPAPDRATDASGHGVPRHGNHDLWTRATVSRPWQRRTTRLLAHFQLKLRAVTGKLESGYTALLLTPDTWQLAWRHDDAATGNYAFYHENGAGGLGLEDKAFREQIKRLNLDA
ncbi:hypothetical protein CHU98_g852 [Xylaria longipes]|nr:hypothetical protein CHU98_g852 [Xylaria longipes]